MIIKSRSCYAVICFVALFLCVYPAITNASLQAASTKTALKVPVGVPLAGYTDYPRKTDIWPVPYFSNYTCWLNPSIGYLDELNIRSVILQTQSATLVFVSIDMVSVSFAFTDLVYDYAAGLGLPVPKQNIIFTATNTHSGPGAINPDFFFASVGYSDLQVPHIFRDVALQVAQNIIASYHALAPAAIGYGTTTISPAITYNRRAKFSPFLNYTSVDSNLRVIRVDKLSDNTPIGVLWNFAVHGNCYPADNMKFSADLFGRVSTLTESILGYSSVALFLNGASGDTDPIYNTLCANNLQGAAALSQTVYKLRESLNGRTISGNVQLQSGSVHYDYGMTQLNLTLVREFNCSDGGPLDVCTICRILDCDIDVNLGPGWIESRAMFGGYSIQIAGNFYGIVVVPGEMIYTFGQSLKAELSHLGFEDVMMVGLANGYMGYFMTEQEYNVGGYEAIMTYWGVHTGTTAKQQCKRVMTNVAPSSLLSQ